MLNRAKILKELEPGLHALFGLAYKGHEMEHREMFQLNSSNRAFEEEVLFAGLGAAVVKPEGGAISYDEAQETITVRYTHETIGLGFQITEEAIDDNLYDSLTKRLTKMLARSMAYTKQVKAANVLNNAFDSNYTGGDGVELCSLLHPLFYGANQANEPSTDADLSEASLESALIDIHNWTDDRGIPIAIRPKKLMIGTGNVFVAERLFATDRRVATADNDINAFKSLGMVPEGYRINHYFTDTDAWFLLTDEPDGLKMFQRKALKTAMEPDFNTGTARFKATERYSVGWSSHRGVYGCKGA